MLRGLLQVPPEAVPVRRAQLLTAARRLPVRVRHSYMHVDHRSDRGLAAGSSLRAWHGQHERHPARARVQHVAGRPPCFWRGRPTHTQGMPHTFWANVVGAGAVNFRWPQVPYPSSLPWRLQVQSSVAKGATGKPRPRRTSIMGNFATTTTRKLARGPRTSLGQSFATATHQRRGSEPRRVDPNDPAEIRRREEAAKYVVGLDAQRW